MQTKEVAMERLHNQKGNLHPEGVSPTPDGVEKGLFDIIRVIEIIINALYREDVIAIGEAVEIDEIITKIKRQLKNKGGK